MECIQLETRNTKVFSLQTICEVKSTHSLNHLLVLFYCPKYIHDFSASENLHLLQKLAASPLT